MQPDDFGQRDKKCVVCGEPTSRVVEGGAVCTKCFTEGWGRLPSMPLPGQEVDKPALKKTRRVRGADGKLHRPST